MELLLFFLPHITSQAENIFYLHFPAVVRCTVVYTMMVDSVLLLEKLCHKTQWEIRVQYMQIHIGFEHPTRDADSIFFSFFFIPFHSLCAHFVFHSKLD